MSNTERPGVYTSYEIVSSASTPLSDGTVGVAALASSGTGGAITDITSASAAASAFGAASNITEIIRVLFKNGVTRVKAVPILSASDSAYWAAFGLLCVSEPVRIIVCDSAAPSVHALLKTAITGATGRNAHKTGIVETDKTAVSDIVAAAVAINCERIVMATPAALTASGTPAVRGSVSAALAGAILASPDAATPVNGAVLRGLAGVAAGYTDAEITTLVRGGVTPVETVGGEVCAVRGITTRTLTDGAADATYRELTTVLVIDDVIPAVRDALRAGFTRTKNTAQTRGAIRSRVVVELEKKLAAGIIDGYSNVSAATDADDSTVCDVSFDFAVARGLNKIVVTARITV